MGRAVHASSEAGAQNTGDEGKLRAATHDVQARDIATELSDAGSARHEQGLHGVHGGVDESRCVLVELGNGDRRGLAVDGHGDELRGGSQGLLSAASVLDEALPGLVAEQTRVGASRRREAGREDHVEVVAADQVQAARTQDLVQRARRGDDRCIERAAAQVVDEDRRALGVQGARVAVRVLKTCGRGLVDHRQDIPARAAEGLQGQESLRGPRVRGNADEGLELFGSGEGSHGGVRAQLAGDVRQEAGQSVEYGDAVVSQAQRGRVGHRRIRQQPLEGAQVGSALTCRVLGVKAVDQAVAVQGEDRRNEVDGVLSIVDEGDDWIVPPINNSDRGCGGAKIYSKSHSTNPIAHFPPLLGRLAGASHVFQ